MAINFIPRADCKYRYDYGQIFRTMAERRLADTYRVRPEFLAAAEQKAAARGMNLEDYLRLNMYRDFVKNDLFFVACVAMGIEKMNHPFIVDMCRKVQDGPKTRTLDVWAREHGKSVTITTAETIQRIVTNPEECHVIFSYKKPKAEDFLGAIKRTLESEFMRMCFPDVLYAQPDRESPSWSLQNGIIVKRKSSSRKEKTVEAYGVIEGMPTGGHWERRIYDDIETADLAKNPEQLQQLITMFEMSRNLGTDGGIERIIGTYYSHCGLLVHLRDKKDIHGEPMYHTRIVPATDDGTINGKTVFLSEERLDELKTDRTFNSQQLCNPTPSDEIALDFARLRPIEPRFLPKNRLKFMIVDPAGDDAVQQNIKNDSWAILCLSVKPVTDDLGNSEVYLEDIATGVMALDEAVDAACTIYMRNGRIAQLGVEKVANDTTYVHIQKALRAKARYLEVKQGRNGRGNLVLLSPNGRAKNRRIAAALSWPLANGKLYYSTAIPQEHIDKIKEEMDKFPFFHVDILDGWAYLYDMLKDFTFYTEEEEDEWEGDSPDNVIPLQGRSKTGGY